MYITVLRKVCCFVWHLCFHTTVHVYEQARCTYDSFHVKKIEDILSHYASIAYCCLYLLSRKVGENVNVAVRITCNGYSTVAKKGKHENLSAETLIRCSVICIQHVFLPCLFVLADYGWKTTKRKISVQHEYRFLNIDSFIHVLLLSSSSLL